MLDRPNGTKRDETGHFRQMTEQEEEEGELSDVQDCSGASSQKTMFFY